MAPGVQALSAGMWRPLPRTYIWSAYVIWFVGSVTESVIVATLPIKEQSTVKVLFAIVLLVVMHGIGVSLAYLRSAPYRAALAKSRAEHPQDVVAGVRLDPLVTPVGAEPSDPGKVDWGLIFASARGVKIVRSDGAVVFDHSWMDFEFSSYGIDVTSSANSEEWWLAFLGETGMWPKQFTKAGRLRQLRQLQLMRPDLSPEERASLA